MPCFIISSEYLEKWSIYSILILNLIKISFIHQIYFVNLYFRYWVKSSSCRCLGIQLALVNYALFKIICVSLSLCIKRCPVVFDTLYLLPFLSYPQIVKWSLALPSCLWTRRLVPGGSVNLTCAAYGSPMPRVRWMKAGMDLDDMDDLPIGRNVLQLRDIYESANYTCVATSLLGTIDTSARVTVQKWVAGKFYCVNYSWRISRIVWIYSETCLQRPPKGVKKTGLHIKQVVFMYRFL